MARQNLTIPTVGEPDDPRVGSQCIKTGNMLFISGQIAYTDGELIGAGDPLEQCRQCFRNIDAYVTKAGGTMDDVVSLNIFLLSLIHI